MSEEKDHILWRIRYRIETEGTDHAEHQRYQYALSPEDAVEFMLDELESLKIRNFDRQDVIVLEVLDDGESKASNREILDAIRRIYKMP